MKNWRETMMKARAKGALPKPVCVVRPLAAVDDGTGEAQADLEINGVIGSWGEEWGEISAEMVKAQLRAAAGAKVLTVHINSPGGEVFEGSAIYNALKEFPGRVKTRVTGIAASAASVIAMAGKRIEMLEGTFLMIHRAWGIAIGNTDEMMQFAAMLETIDGEIARIYANRSGGNVDQILELMSAETWMSPTMAVEHGLADAAIEASPKTASALANAFDLSVFGYAKVPDGLARTEMATAEGDGPTQGDSASEEPEEEGDNPTEEQSVEDALRMQRLEAAKARLKFKQAGGVTC